MNRMTVAPDEMRPETAGAVTSEAAGWWKSPVVWLLAAAIGLMFALPHLVRIAELGSYAAYTPFTSKSPNAMVWDETFLYGAEANYTLTRHGAPAYADSWEHRADVYPYSIVPITIEAEVAAVVGGLKTAHILLSFLFPMLSAVLLIVMFGKLGAGKSFSAFLAVGILVGAFSAKTVVLDVGIFLRHAQGAIAIDTLQGGRIPNPSMTFPHYLATMMCLAAAIWKRNDKRLSAKWAIWAGVLGGLLFFSYVFYAITWTGVLVLLSLVALFRAQTIPRTVWLALIPTFVMAAFFEFWQHISVARGIYVPRATRLGLYHSHELAPFSVPETIVFGGGAILFLGLWLWVKRFYAKREQLDDRWQYADALMFVVVAGVMSGLAGMNMQVVTGFNIQSVQHYPHMVLQPLDAVMLGLTLALVARRTMAWKVVGVVAFVASLSFSAIAQFESGRDTASLHFSSPADRALFGWLNQNTPVGSVVAADDLGLCIVLPAMTHNSVLFSNGSRSSGSDDEIMERFLLASHLSGATAEEVETELSIVDSLPTPVPATTTAYYMYEFSLYQRIRAERRIAPARMPEVLNKFRTMDVNEELRRFRVDYLWTQKGREPENLPGRKWTEVFANEDGRLWSLSAG